MGLSYGRNKFQAATRTLVSNQPLDQRIIEAYSNYLIHLREDDLSAEAVPEFQEMMRRTAGTQTGLNDDIASRISALPINQLEAIAERIVNLNTILCEAYERKKTLTFHY